MYLKGFSIILPTYNEADNVKILIPKLVNIWSSQEFNYEIIVVDDNSPDGTAEIARKFAETYPIKVFVRTHRLGLSSAIIYGARKASYGYVIVMDADLQHPPEKTIDIAYSLSSGCDIAVASRYISGGGIEGWSRIRLLESKIATYLAYMLLPVTRKTSDPMSGFFGCKREYLLDPRIKPIGYKILIEIICLNPNARICDVPYIFKSRLYGGSKLSSSVILDYIKQLVYRRFH